MLKFVLAFGCFESSIQSNILKVTYPMNKMIGVQYMDSINLLYILMNLK